MARFGKTGRSELATWVSLGILVGLLVLRGTATAPFVRATFENLLASPSGDAELSSLSNDALIARVKADERALQKSSFASALNTLLIEENEKLRGELRYAVSAEFITARVISRPPRTHYDTLILDKGSDDGAESGDIAEYEGVALGRVVSTSAHASLVELYSNPGREEDVVIGEPAAVTVARGLGGGAFETSVPQNISIEAGNPVRLQNSETLLIGVVISLTASATDISKTVRFSIPFSLSELDYVRIIPGNTAP